jgi:DNA-binding transcriptional MocR family regulator
MKTRAAAELLIRVDPNGGETLQQQIYGGVRRAILTGLVKPGSRLPSSRAIASDLGVSRTTSLLALEQLVAEGYVTTRRFCGGMLRVRPVLTGLHAVADLDGVDDERVSQEAMARGVEAMPLSMYFSGSTDANGILLGFAPVRPEDSADGMRRLAASIEAAQSSRGRVQPETRVVRA